MRPGSEPALQPPEVLLRRVALELQHCEAMLKAVETAVTPLMASDMSPAERRALQDIDRLGQGLADLAACITGLATDLRDARPIDAQRVLAALRLDELAQRLAGRPAAPLPAAARLALF